MSRLIDWYHIEQVMNWINLAFETKELSAVIFFWYIQTVFSHTSRRFRDDSLFGCFVVITFRGKYTGRKSKEKFIRHEIQYNLLIEIASPMCVKSFSVYVEPFRWAVNKREKFSLWKLFNSENSFSLIKNLWKIIVLCSITIKTLSWLINSCLKWDFHSISWCMWWSKLLIFSMRKIQWKSSKFFSHFHMWWLSQVENIIFSITEIK